MSGAWVWIIAVAAGIASFAAYWLALRGLASWAEYRRTRKEKWKRERRTYQAFDRAKQYPASKNLFYECPVCGNAIPSLPKKSVSCKCGNILIDADSGRVEIRDRAKVRLFSLTTP